MSNIKTITGKLNGFSNGVAEILGANSLTKASSNVSYDYIEINEERWGNFILSGSVNDVFEKSVDKEVTINYVERKLNGITKRVVVGLEIDGKLETILVDDIEPAHKAVGMITNMLGLTMLVFWVFIGGFISFAVGMNAGTILGYLTFFSGVALILFITSKIKKSRLKYSTEILEYARANNKIK